MYHSSSSIVAFLNYVGGRIYRRRVQVDKVKRFEGGGTFAGVDVWGGLGGGPHIHQLPGPVA